MSYSVILVEDEMLVLEDMASTTDWSGLDLNLIATATNGVEGEEKIKTLEPDIVVTDIRLPGQDGLTMLSHCPVTHAIILSGFTDFSYMQTAIRLGVFDYLQKPIDSTELEDTLRKLVARIKDEDQDMITFNNSNTSEGSVQSINLPVKVENHLINLAINFMQKNFSTPMGLQETAASINVSESHLSRLFKEVTGLNFLTYLNALRVNKALELLSNNENNVSAIAISCGFPTPGYFSKIFKRFLGVTPTVYRDNGV